jgi:tRNA pseudouridine32 synthase / 23S rRNA pseudouridine746 synthase
MNCVGNSAQEIGVIHADAALIVIDKPAGLLAVPGRGADKQDCAASRVQAQFADARVVHRLDQPTSGLLLFARGAPIQSQLARAFAQRAVQKHYVAVVHGHVAAPSGSIDLPLAADWPARPKQMVDHAHGKPALTHYRVLAHLPNGTTRLALQPITGRTHQLRVHLAAIGHAIVGDALYANEASAPPQPRLLLHAARLVLTHPLTAMPLQYETGVPF